jgi:hypothetical protein
MSYLATQRGLTVEAIRQVKADWGREQRLANYLESVSAVVANAYACLLLYRLPHKQKARAGQRKLHR